MITEMKNTLEGADSILANTMEITQTQQQNEKKIFNEDSVRDLCDKIEHVNILLQKFQEKRERKKQRYI